MVNLALLQQTIEGIEEQSMRAKARVTLRRAKQEISRHECDAQLTRIEQQMQQRISRLIQQMV